MQRRIVAMSSIYDQQIAVKYSHNLVASSGKKQRTKNKNQKHKWQYSSINNARKLE